MDVSVIPDTRVPRIMRNVAFATTYIPLQVLYNQLTYFSNYSNSIDSIVAIHI